MTDEKQPEEMSKTENSVDELLNAAGPQIAPTLLPPSTPDLSYPLYVATHTFSSELDGDLNFKKGDRLYIINQDNKNRWYARAKESGQEGYIPINYVTRPRASKVAPKPIPDVSQYPLYKGKYDFSLENDKYLSFKKGDLMYILNNVEGDWWFAWSKRTGQEGYVPYNYVAAFNTMDAEE